MLTDRSPPFAGSFAVLANRPRLGLLLLIWSQFALVACTYPAYAPTPSYQGEFAPGAQRYGVDGQLSQRQYATLKGLAWPQTYDDMKGTFGLPSHRTSTADYYALAGDRSIWVVVWYEGKTAVSYSTEARYE